MPVQEGKKAPNFKLASTEGKEMSLSDFNGNQVVVLYFYPKDDTPGCTQEACDFRDSLKKFKIKGAAILGVSADSLQAHAKFQKKYSLPFTLICYNAPTKLDYNKRLFIHEGIIQKLKLNYRK